MRNNKGQFTHGSKHLVTHGKHKTPAYNIWVSMKARCCNPNTKAFADYGARGITVCERWQDFANFYADMGERPKGMTLDRVDNDLGYSPDNCRWATRIEQARNRRGIHMVTVDGVERPLWEWAEITGIKLQTLWARLHSGWSPERTMGTPVRISGRWHGAKHSVEWSEPRLAA